ncbi:DUF2254 domain-containing protein [Gudongella sp. DL1XJH-153]|uniref:DUF2254 domain-containing protein n=1 Tax=Gudongella sp. DL1XJH-153 TaxID=3409804 RepID=UPI003BB5834D
MLQRIILKFRKSVWIYPAIISSLSFIGAVVIGMSDSGRFIAFYKFVPVLFMTSTGLSKDILGVIAASLITMTTFTFSTTMIVLTTYSAQFGPRTVENFLSDDDTMKTTGVFMGGFIYSIVTMLFMRNAIGEQLVVSATIGIVYAIVCLIQFTMYIQHVGSYIQTNNLINRLQRDAEKKIDEYKALLEKGKLVDESTWGREDMIIRIKSKEEGYIQLIDHNEIYRTVQDIKGILLLEKLNGQFVTNESVLFSIFFEEEVKIDEESIDKLLDCLTIGKQKSEMQDFNFTIQKIVEIALRAISTGINDPNTASHCLRIMGVLMGKIARLEGGYLMYRDDKEYPKVAFEVFDFSRQLNSSYHQIIHYGKEDVSVMKALLKSMRFTAEKASSKNKAAIDDYLQYIWNELEKTHGKGYDLNILEKEKNEIIDIVTE